MSTRRSAVALLLLLTVTPGPATAQDNRATLLGTILDQSNASIPNARISVTNLDTNVRVQTESNEQGNYAIPFLNPGNYQLTVEREGFKTFQRSPIRLEVASRVRIDVTIELGAVSDSVVVRSETPTIETANADRGTVLGSLVVQEMPIKGRNPFMLSVLVPGVNYVGAMNWQRPFDNGANAAWSMNGGLPAKNEFLLDGAPNNSLGSGPFGSPDIALVPSVDSVGEFKIQTNSYDAQYGRTAGGIVNVSLKSGTNMLHGTAYEFARREGWEANSFQNNARGFPRADHTLDQWGFQFDGPVYIPKVFDGRNRLFFMGSYERYDEIGPLPLTLSVPEPEMRTGNFSKLTDASGRQVRIFDPATGRDVNGTWTRDPFPGNIIPAGRVSPIAQKILTFMPQPNIVTPGAGYAQQNFSDPTQNFESNAFYNLAFKFDANISERHRLFFRHASNDWTYWRPGLNSGFLGRPGVEGGCAPLQRINDAYVLDWTSIISPRFIVNLRTSVNRYGNKSTHDANRGFDMTTLGFPESLVSQLPYGDWFGRYQFDQYIRLGQYQNNYWSNTVAAHPSISALLGSHNIKAGADMRWPQWSSQNMGTPFVLTSGRNFTQQQFNRADTLSGDSIATWLLGTPSSGSIDYNPFLIHLRRYYAPYVQDDWRVTRRLTLNLGLRLDFASTFDERYNRLNRGFDFSSVNPADQLIDRTAFPGFTQLKGGLLFAGVGGQPRAATDLDRSNVQPRAGFALQLSQRLVVRGGWGRYFPPTDRGDIKSFGFSQSTLLVPSIDDNRTPIPNLLNNPFPNGAAPVPGSSLGLLTSLGRELNFVNTGFQLPVVDQFSLGFQVEMPFSSRVEVAYVGSRTRHGQTSKPINVFDRATRDRCNVMEGGNPAYCDQLLPNPFRGLVPFQGTTLYSAASLPRAQLAVPYPHFGGLEEDLRNDGRIWYNSVQVSYQVRNRGGLNLTASYTLSKMISEGILGGDPNRGLWNDVQGGVLNRGLHEIDRPHRLVLSTVYELPIGKNKRFLNTTHPVWSRLLGGWQSSFMLTAQSGIPWALPGNVLYLKDARIEDVDWSAARVQGVRPCVARWNDNGSITPQSFSTAAGCTDYNFLVTPRYAPRFTPYRDGRIRMHSVPQADASLNKTTQITERIRLQFRAEAFNLTNTFNYGFNNAANNLGAHFNNNPENANFGQIIPASLPYTSTSVARNIQLGIKLLW